MNAIKRGLLHIAVGGMKVMYAPLKMLSTGKKVTLISRQSNEPSIDIKLVKDEIKRQHPDWDVVVLSRRLSKTPAYIGHIIKQMYHIATSQTVVLDSYCIPISVLHHKKELQVIQMWHALGSMKCFGYAMLGKEEGRDPDVARILKMHNNYDIALISSKSFIKDYIEGFNIEPEKIVKIPLPRADLLADGEYMSSRRDRMIAQHPQLGHKKNILYCPTYRKEPGTQDRTAIEALLTLIDFDKYNLIYKPHELSKLYIEDPRVIKNINNNLDAIAVADFVISDYSSIIYEVGLAKKPLYLYAYDWEEYKSKRLLNLDLKNDTGLMFISDPAEIIGAIESDHWDGEHFYNFVMDNVRFPGNGSCAHAIVDIIRE